MHFHYSCCGPVLRFKVENEYRQPGEAVLFRFVRPFMSVVWGWPKIVVEDREDMVALWMPEGAVIERYDLDEGKFVEPLQQRLRMLPLMFLGRARSLVLYFDAGTGVPPCTESTLTE